MIIDLSVTQPGAAIANVASGRTSPVHFSHSWKGCYISEKSFSAFSEMLQRTISPIYSIRDAISCHLISTNYPNLSPVDRHHMQGQSAEDMFE